MKTLIKILLSISIIANIYLAYDFYIDYCNKEKQKRVDELNGVNKTTWKDGFEQFKIKIKEKYPELESSEYYYLNTWAAFCSPCIREMPWLDSISVNLDNKKVSYFFISEMNERLASDLIVKKGYKLEKFVFMNEMNNLISSICNENKIKTKVFPMHLIIKNDGEIIHFSLGAYENLKEISEFGDLIKKYCQ